MTVSTTLLTLTCAGLGVVVWRLRRERDRQIELRQAERQGRIRAEQKLRSDKLTNDKDESFRFTPIGYVSSPFAKRLGTPRQPTLVEAAESVIELDSALRAAVDSIENFSHIWVLFLFHGNTNMAKRMHSKRPFDGLKLLVEPPKARGQKVGLLACRTPHRPNPIGLSLCKLQRVEGNKIHVSGLDCLDGTPVIDIKPYLPIIECIPDAIVPEWIYQGVDEDREVSVEWSCEIPADPKLASLIQQTLSRDIRSRNQIEIGNSQSADWVGELVLKNAHVSYSIGDDKIARILSVV
jgi:tRNA (adenine37-N6)-methyltransferase